MGCGDLRIRVKGIRGIKGFEIWDVGYGDVVMRQLGD